MPPRERYWVDNDEKMKSVLRFLPEAVDPQCILSLVARKKSTHALLPSGSGVMISPQLALTVRHVLEDYWHRAEYQKLSPGQHHQASYYVEATPGFQLGGCEALQSHHQSLSELTDVAFLFMEPLPKYDGSLRFPAVSLIPPKKGSTVYAVGFPSRESDWDFAKGVEGYEGRTFSLNNKGMIAKGIVKNVYVRPEDSPVKFPCFEVDIPCEPGMSGGPVYTDGGDLCGLITKSWEFAEEGEPLSRAVLLWAAMATDLSSFNIKRIALENYHPALMAAQQGLFQARGTEWLYITPQRDGRVTLTLLDYRLGRALCSLVWKPH